MYVQNLPKFVTHATIMRGLYIFKALYMKILSRIVHFAKCFVIVIHNVHFSKNTFRSKMSFFNDYKIFDTNTMKMS